MPRAKVAPENRQRVSRACQSCQASKKRCDGQQPCNLCTKHDRAESCVYTTSGARNAPRASPYTRPARESLSGSRSFAADHEQIPNSAGPSHVRASQNSRPTRGTARKTTQFTKSQLLPNSRGEKVYIGDTASLAFLQFLRQVLRQHIGPSDFTESPSNVMLEVQSPEAALPNLVENPSRRQTYVNTFLATSSGILDLYSTEEINEFPYLDSSPTNDVFNTVQQIEVLLVMAIGAQCSKSTTDVAKGRSYFDRGRQIAFQNMLENPSLSMVRAFLLMAFYMLGACQRNTACMYLGVSAKFASIIGLHDSSNHKRLSKSEEATRLRAWRSLCTMDIIVHTLLGRLTSFSSIMNLGDGQSQQISGATPSTVLDASIMLCFIIEKSLLRLKGLNSLNFEEADMSLSELRDTMDHMPSEFRSIRTNGLQKKDPTELRTIVGNIHLACIYYYAVILVSRPYLISHIILKLSNDDHDSIRTVLETSAEISQMAETCIDAALYMATMSYEAQKAGVLLANMCILKAWIFLAGLVLGFSLCTHVDERTVVENAFEGAREVLFVLSRSSPQAKEYWEILGRFADAIRRSREQAAQQRSRKSRKYISQVLSFDNGEVEQPSYRTPELGGTVAFPLDLGDFATQDTGIADQANSQLMLDSDFEAAGLGHFVSQINEFFPFDYNSMGVFYET